MHFIAQWNKMDIALCFTASIEVDLQVGGTEAATR